MNTDECRHGDGSPAMSYANSSKYDPELEIQDTERMIEELSCRIIDLRTHLKSLQDERSFRLLDVVGDRTVIRFSKTHGYGGSVYHYAAIKAGKWWYVSSDGLEHRKDTAGLKKFIGHNPIQIMVPNKDI